VLAWVVGGLRFEGYSPIDDAISRLAAQGASTQILMNMGFVGFGVCVPVYALALRRALPGWAWASAATTGVATLAVAAFPLGYAESIDGWHNASAGVGYLSLAITPWLAFSSLRGDRPRLAWFGVACGCLSVVCLVLSVWVEGPNGFFQRLGLTATDAWIVASVPFVRARLAGNVLGSTPTGTP
jgi:hypothetical membrane protein